MAEVIESMPPERPDSHPWGDLLDGQRWKLKRGDDYDCDEALVARRARGAARRRGISVDVRYSRSKGFVCIQARRT
jgi:hypothetical protein